MSDETLTEPVITATCRDCGPGWQKTGRGEHECDQVTTACRDHEDAYGHLVVWTVEHEGGRAAEARTRESEKGGVAHA